MSEDRKKLAVPDLAARKRAGEKVVMASVADFPMAVWAERAGIEPMREGFTLTAPAGGSASRSASRCTGASQATRAAPAPSAATASSVGQGSSSHASGKASATRA